MSKITKIETCKRNKERVNIYIDDEFAFAIDMELVYKFNLKIKKEIDREKLELIVIEENFSKCKNSALRTIERSYKTEKEIRDKLIQKEFNEDTINRTIEFLKEYKFIDDEKYVRMYIKDRLINQGRNKIKYALTTKGVNSNLIEQIFEEFNKDDEREKAYYLAEKKYNSLLKRESDKYKLRNKAMRYLLGRGYEYDLAKEVLSEVEANNI